VDPSGGGALGHGLLPHGRTERVNDFETVHCRI
jgi:hypothetical protein